MYARVAMILLSLVLAGLVADPVMDSVLGPETDPATSAGPERVEVSGARWRSVQPTPERPVATRWVQSRSVDLEVVPTGIVVRGTWKLRATEPGVFVDRLLPADAHVTRASWDGRPASLWTTSAGTFVVGHVDKTATLVLEAFIPTAEGTRDFPLLGATVGSLGLRSERPFRIVASDGTPVMRSKGRYRTGASTIAIAPPPATTAPGGAVVLCEVGLGLTVGDGAVAGKAKVQWSFRRGQAQTLGLDVAGVGSDLAITGPNIANWEREGDRVTLELKTPASGRVDAELNWSSTLSSAAEQALPVPTVLPRDVFRVEATLQIARDGSLDVLPSLPGWTPLPSALLPAFGRGLVAGNPTAAYRQTGSPKPAQLDLVRFEPVEGPPVVVDIADLHIAASAEGRRLTLARYEVLNERAPFLDFTLPPGARLVGVWVTGRQTAALQVEGELRVPLRRSLETVRGLLTFPVVVAFVEEGTPWGRRIDSELVLPVVDAPVNVSRVSLRLPRDYRSGLDQDDPDVVESFSHGKEVAFGLREPDLVARADEIYADALDAWQSNDFEGARAKLTALERVGARSDNQAGLESNVDLVLGAPEEPAPASGGSGSSQRLSVAATPTISTKTRAVGRRIRAQVRARSAKRRARQQKYKKKAKSLKNEGRYEEAEASFKQALEETEELERLEDDESTEYEFEADEIDAELQELRQEAAAREQLESNEQTDAAEHAPFDYLVLDPQLPPSQPNPPALAPVAMPRGGTNVRYQHLLLAPGAVRQVRIKARRLRVPHRSRRRRK